MSKIMSDTTHKVAVKRGEDLTMFVPADIDEYGFSPAQFRIFARIMRRSVGEHSQGCFESIQRLSLNLGISKRIVQESLKILKLAGCIRIIKREGDTSLIAFQPYSKWVSKTAFDAIVYEVTGKRIQRDKERKMTPSAETLPSAETHYPLVRKRTTKGIPSKGIHLNLAETASTSNQEESVSVKSEHAKGMEFLHKTLGAFPDGGAQGKALKWMLGQGATLKEIQDGLVRHVREVNGKYRPSYTTLQKIIFQWAKPLPEKQYFKIDIEKEEDEYDRRIASQSGSSGR